MKKILFLLVILLVWASPSPLWAETLDFAEQLFAMQEYDRSEAELQRALAKDPAQAHQVRVYWLRIQLAQAQNQFAQAARIAEQGGERFGDAKLTQLAARNYLMSGQPEKAQSLYQTQLQGAPAWPEAKPEPWPTPVLGQALLPGAGFALQGNLGQGLASLTLNATFLRGANYALTHSAPAMGALLLFFEWGWYKGGIQAVRLEYQSRQEQDLLTRRLALLQD